MDDSKFTINASLDWNDWLNPSEFDFIHILQASPIIEREYTDINYRQASIFMNIFLRWSQVWSWILTHVYINYSPQCLCFHLNCNITCFFWEAWLYGGGQGISWQWRFILQSSGYDTVLVWHLKMKACVPLKHWKPFSNLQHSAIIQKAII
jgi:hypothetical protein